MSQEGIALPTERDASGRSFGPEELELLTEVIQSGILFGPNGTKVRAFEEELQALFGVSHARAVSSGSAAVHTALGALDVAPGDEIITTPITDMGAIAPILFQGAIPIFADVDPVTLNVTAETLLPRITSRTRAIIVTHLFGNPCDMDPILALARERGVAIIEDASQAYLATYRGALAGTMGDIAAFSLQQTKHMTCGEGGFVLTNSAALARRARVWADKGYDYASNASDHDFLGLNYRMSELQGAVALGQVRKLRAMVEHRVSMAEALRARLLGIPGVRAIPTTPGATQTYWRFVLLIDETVLPGGPQALAAELRPLGVWSTPRYIRMPAFMCKLFQERRTFGHTQYPYSVYPDAYPVEQLDDYPGCRDGLSRVLVLPWTERHEMVHVEFLAEQIARAVERITAAAGSHLMERTA
jgi:dTDP-4-amino-4,6-dideoxygalactose transaminase